MMSDLFIALLVEVWPIFIYAIFVCEYLFIQPVVSEANKARYRRMLYTNFLGSDEMVEFSKALFVL